MTQSSTSDQLTLDAPRNPIIILGRNDYYVVIPATAEEAIALVRDSKDDGLDAVPPVDTLDFFDAVGRRLEPIVVAGQLVGLAVHNYQDEIRYRIDRFHHYLSTGVGRGVRPPEPRPFTDEKLDFEASIRAIAEEEAALRANNCNWWLRLWGHC